MLKGLTFATSLAVLSALSLPVMAEEPTADTVVARVNGEEITLGHMILATAALPQQYQGLPTGVLFDAVLEQLIQQTALMQSGPEQAPPYVAFSLENERRSLLAAEAINKVVEGAASDADIQAAYDAKYKDGMGEEEYNASHILVATEDEAKAIVADIKGGADFADTAKVKSTGPSGPSGGSLGWFGPGSMVPEFEAAVVSLEPGQLSDPVQTQFGWHVIILNEKRRSEAPALDAVRDELADEVRQSAVEARVEELTDAATIERPNIAGFNPELVRNLDLVKD